MVGIFFNLMGTKSYELVFGLTLQLMDLQAKCDHNSEDQILIAGENLYLPELIQNRGDGFHAQGQIA